MDRYSGQPGRVGCGASVCANSAAASTALLPFGRSTAAVMPRVVTSTAIVSSGRRERLPVLAHEHQVQQGAVHPDTAARSGLVDHGRALVTSARGSMTDRQRSAAPRTA